MTHCDACGGELTAEEAYYYEDRCEDCERLAHERLAAWREGAHDPEMDAGRFFIMPDVH